MLPFVKIFAAFFLMLVGIRCRLGLWLSVLAGGFSMAVLYGLPLDQWIVIAAKALVQEKFLFLIAIVGLILVLSDGLERSGQSKRLIDALSGYLTRPKIRLLFFPALIGLLPMPGGAVFSAPMVKAVSEDMPVSDVDRAVINYWFRHVWELAWPLYPGIILTVALADIPLSSFISKTWPGIVAMFFFGWFFLLRGVKSEADYATRQENDVSAVNGGFLYVLLQSIPLLIAIVGAVGLEVILAKFFPHIPFEWGVLAALLASAVSIMVQNRLGRSFLGQIVTKKSLWSMLLVIAAIFIFKDTMQAAGVVEAMAAASSEQFALLTSATLLPFLVGMVAGINVCFVGACFPLILGLLELMHVQEQMLAYLVLGTFCGFTGVMISPIHICFMLTCEYFHVDLLTTWRRLVLPCLGCLLVGVALFFLLLN
ncbi:DUF401 family protein [Desulfogranum japonicum]|uniref:DUF401 family protein n=1 Tax=Desulfogranum japonicum TaxID=231447 RepID=UPI0003F50C23|nr:DUF401 family protein [Desulfogranum japonicum]